MTFSRVLSLNVTVDATDFETTALSATASYASTSFAFSEEYPVGSFAASGFPNHLFVVAPGGVMLTGSAPATQSVNGSLAFGIMANPLLSASAGGTSAQGWDELLALGGRGSGLIAYDDARNLDPSKPNGAVQTIVPHTTLVKAMRNPNAAASDWNVFDGYVHLHVLDDTPPLGAFPPSSSALTKKIWGITADVDFSVLRAVNLSALSTTPTAALADLPQDAAEWGASRADDYRLLRQDIQANGIGSNYSADYAPFYGRAMIHLHNAAATVSERSALAHRLIGWGIQIAGVRERGVSLNGGAGQGGGVSGPLYAAALLLQNASLLATAQGTETLMTRPLWLRSDQVGAGASGANNGIRAQTVFEEHVGIPHIIPDEFGSNHDSRYFAQGTAGYIWEMLGLLLFQPGARLGDGLTVFLNGDSLNATSDTARAPSVAFMDRVRHMTPWVNGNRDPGSEWRNLYDAVQSAVGWAVWTGPPDQVPYGAEGEYMDNIFSPGTGAGEIRFDAAAFDYSTLPAVQTDVRYALDNGTYPVQWITVDDAGDTGTLTGLLSGQSHWCGLRRRSARGAGIYSLNYPRNDMLDGSIGRGQVVTAGIAAASAPVNTIAPVIHSRKYPGWAWKIWEPATTTLDKNSLELAAGLGYWAGYPAPTFTFQWKRNGTSVAGATLQFYTRTLADAGASLTCEITATNASGAVPVTTAPVAAPALTTLSAGTIIDTDFKGAFAIDYATEFAAIIEDSANAVHEPGQGFSGLDGANIGGLKCDKTGNYPNIYLPLPSALSNGATYRFEAQIVCFDGWDGRELRFDVQRQVANSSYLSSGTKGFTINEAQVIDIDETFVASGELDAEVRIGNNTATGSNSGGDPYLSYLKISEV